jgi:hypothetical protein
VSEDDYSGVKAGRSGLQSLGKGLAAFSATLTFAVLFIVGLFIYMMLTAFDI